YFDTYPGIWRHGDWVRITPRGGAIIYGRSDATINRHGIRMGTSELYRAVEALPEVLDSMVVDLEYLGRESYMPLFVVLRPDIELTPGLTATIRDRIKVALSARHVPNEVFQVTAIPRTLSGKKMELPIKKLLLGQPLENVANPDTMANPASLAWLPASPATARRPAGNRDEHRLDILIMKLHQRGDLSMKLKHIAFAGLSVGMVGAAGAQSVTLYGVADMNFEFANHVGAVPTAANGFNSGPGQKVTRLDSGGVSGSRWGL
ncbi:acetoacetyl-CoA synthetase, partial [Cupriavidus basilensis OR16]